MTIMGHKPTVAWYLEQIKDQYSVTLIENKRPGHPTIFDDKDGRHVSRALRGRKEVLTWLDGFYCALRLLDEQEGRK